MFEEFSELSKVSIERSERERKKNKSKAEDINHDTTGFSHYHMRDVWPGGWLERCFVNRRAFEDAMRFACRGKYQKIRKEYTSTRLVCL